MASLGIALIAIGIAGIIITAAPASLVHRIFPSLKKIRGTKRVIALEELAPLWKNAINTQEQAIPESSEVNAASPASPAPHISFNHEEIKTFYNKYIAGNIHFAGTKIFVIEDILKLLDQEGDCPSVVNAQGEEEAKLWAAQRNVYDILARTTLASHTIHVAEEMISLTAGSGPMLPKIMIAALGHDLGKLPSRRKSLYAMGDHPLISIAILNQMDGFKELSFKDEVFKAIQGHHKDKKGIQQEDFLAIKLKEADQAARRRELAANAKDGMEQLSEAASHNMEPVPAVQKIPPISYPPQPIRHEIFESPDSEKQKIRMKETELSWFDPDQFLTELKPYINKLNGGRWDAFSMRDGYVYVQVKTLWEIAKKLARDKDKSVLLGDADDELRRNIVYSIVERLKTDKDAIARGLVKDGYFGAPFIVKMRDGTEYTKGFYTPFNAEAFAGTVSELEMLKTGKLRDIVDVTPRFE